MKFIKKNQKSNASRRRISLSAVSVFLLAAALLCLCFCSCARVPDDGSGKGEKVKIVASNFPAYDFARRIAGDRAELRLLISPGSDAHSYDPTPSDILALESCDLFICTGGESDVWVDDILAASTLGSDERSDAVLKMTDCVELVAEETVEGMQEEHENGEEEAEEEEGEEEYDEHVWTSPLNVCRIAEAIARRISEIDPENADEYAAACAGFQSELEELDRDFREVVSEAEQDRQLLIFGDRFPFRYFTEEYGLSYYAAFPGCASDTEPGASTVAFLIEKAKEEEIPVILYLELSDAKIAAAIAEECGAETMLFHSCHNVTKNDFLSGETYLTLMRGNIDVLRAAMGQ